MSLFSPLLAAGLGWVLGVALQLQQSVLWPFAAYAAALGLGLALLLVAWRALRVPAWPLWLMAGLLIGAGLTGARAVV